VVLLEAQEEKVLLLEVAVLHNPQKEVLLPVVGVLHMLVEALGEAQEVVVHHILVAVVEAAAVRHILAVVEAAAVRHILVAVEAAAVRHIHAAVVVLVVADHRTLQVLKEAQEVGEPVRNHVAMRVALVFLVDLEDQAAEAFLFLAWD
jgi:hypothetical protein